MSTETTCIKNFFQSHHIPLSDVWLNSCIAWCKEENLRPNYTQKDLQLNVYEQWLLLDLRDVALPSLPPNLTQRKKFQLNGNYSLQMMKLIDISKPKLWQLQKIRNTTFQKDNQDAETVGTGKRVLQLTLTDGVQEVEAIEYRPIPKLNVNLSPGIKIQLTGPLMIRRGRLMLEEKHVKILGGEVDELIVPNAAENVLARLLKLPENPQPKVVEESFLTANKDIFNTQQERSTTNYTNQVIKPNQIMNKQIANNSVINKNCGASIFNSITEDEEMDILLEAERNFQTEPTSKKSKIMEPNEEEMRIAEEVDLLLEAERSVQLQPKPKKPKIQANRSSNMFEDGDFDSYDFNTLNQFESSNSNKKQNNLILSQQSFEQDDDIFDNIDIDEHLDKVEGKIFSTQTQQTALVTVQKLLQNKDHINKGLFKVKAKFKSVAEKLTVKDDEFKLTIEISDATGDMVARVHSDVISDYAGYRPAALMALKSSILDKDGNATTKVLRAIQNIKDKLVELDDILEIQICKNEVPLIINVIK